jgi:hypothetical protein
MAEEDKRFDRKCQLVRLMRDRHSLDEIYSQAIGQKLPAQATEWDLIRSILDIEFPRPPVKFNTQQL